MNKEPVSICFEGEIAWVTIDNPPVNATNQAVRQGLLDAVSDVQGARYAVLKCAGKTFVAGGDMSEFDGPALEPHLPDVVQAIENSEVPFLALLHGRVLGGGLEIAMGCSWRIAARGTSFGLPEVNVGLIPGAGGTQRAPRLFGMDMALDMAAAGRMFDAEELLGVGGLDQVFEGDADEAGLAFLAMAPQRPDAISMRPVARADEDELAKKCSQIEKRARGQRAPLKNIEALSWAKLPFAKGQPQERALHLEMRQGAESKALRYVFFSEREVAKPTAAKGATARQLTKMAVVGGGLMGAGIATTALSAGLDVAVIERDAAAAQAARDRVEGLINGAVTRGKLSNKVAQAQKARLSTHDCYDGAADVDIAIEAVFEDLTVKQNVFAKLAAVISPHAILATNTSYLDPGDIFHDIDGHERCIGLHFFSPAHVMKLLEIVPLAQTSPEVIATGFDLGKRLGKISVMSGICDGFIGNRMLSEYRRAAEYFLADGALPHEVDAAARGLGFSMGPFELQDLTGLQIAWANRKRQAAMRPKEQRYETIADQLCEAGRLGQRSGKGWYDYVEGDRKPRHSDDVKALILQHSKMKNISRRQFEMVAIQERLLAVLANEGARIVEEGIAESDAAIDMVQLHGYAFPRWRGGPMHVAAVLGWGRIAEIISEMEKESPDSWVLSQRALSAEKRREA